VLSRPCVIGHKPTALVAAVQEDTDRVPKEVQPFEDILDFLTDLRDAPNTR
jgi:hypothetical protein